MTVTGTDLRTIRCHLRPPIAEIVLDRPESGNTITAELLSELADVTMALATKHRDPGRGPAGQRPNFCFGADVGMFIDEPAERRPTLIRDLVTRLHTAVTRLRRLAPGGCRRRRRRRAARPAGRRR